MKISPNITLRLAKSQLAARVVPRILRFAASVFGFTLQFAKTDLIRAEPQSDITIFIAGIRFDKQAVIEGARVFRV